MDYKQILSNQLIIFVNEHLNKNAEQKYKVENLEEKDQKRFQEVIVNNLVEQAKQLAQIQGLQYLGVRDEVVTQWIDKFFEKFDENMKEKEKPKKTKTKSTKAKEETYKITDGLFGKEITVGKEILTSSEFEEKFKDKEIIWKEDKVIVKDKDEGENEYEEDDL